MSISLYWNDELKKITYSNVPLNTFGEFDKILPSIFKIKALNNYDNSFNKPWYNSGFNIISSNLSNIGIGTSNPKEKLNLIGDLLINGSIIPNINSNFNLGSSNLRWKNLYLSSNSTFINNISCSNFQLNDNFNNFLIFSLSNNQLILNSNGIIINTIKFNDYSNIIYSDILFNTSNELINNINNIINYFSNINTNTINIGSSNRFITSNIYSNNLTVTSNLFINGNFYLKNQLLPFSINSNTSIITSNGLFSYINNCNFGYYTFLTNGSITFPQTTNCDILVVGAGGNGGIGPLSGGGGAGEIISYPNYSFNSGTYNIRIGTSSFNSNTKISSIRSNNILILAQGGGDGASIYSYSNGVNLNIGFINNAILEIPIINSFSNLPSNNYNIIVNDGLINITNLNNNQLFYNFRPYPILLDINGNTINPILWYKFENNLNDSGTQSKNLSVRTGTARYNNTINVYRGISSFYFDGSTNLENTTLSVITIPFTISLWLKIMNINQYQTALALNSSASVIFNLDIERLNNNQVTLKVAISINNQTIILLSSNVDFYKWVLYTVTVEVNTATNNAVATLYINGIFNISEIGTSSTLTSNPTIIYIGTNGDGFNRPYNGYINDLRIYNVALTAQQVFKLYNTNVNIYTPSSINSGGLSSSYSNIYSNAAIINNKWNNQYSFFTNGSNGIFNRGGNGGSALSNIGFTSLITGNSLIVGEGGNGATSNSIPILDQTYGSGGDGNGGLGTQGIIIIRTPLDVIKSQFDGYTNYNSIINTPVLNNLFTNNYFINIGFNNQVNFPLADVAWANEWFLYIGNSPTSVPNSFIFWHLTSNINSKWWFNGTTATTNAEISDNRIKKEITNIENPINKLMALQPKEYYLCDEKDYLKKYGILAQDVYSNQDLKHLVYQDEEYIANIYTNAIYNNKIITTEISIIDKIEINDEIKILIDNNENKEIIIEDLPYHNRYKKRYIKIKEIINNNSFEIYEEIEIMENEKNKIFIYGKKVNDFLKLDYSSLYSLNIEVNKQLYNLIQDNNLLINDLNKRVSKLEK